MRDIGGILSGLVPKPDRAVRAGLSSARTCRMRQNFSTRRRWNWRPYFEADVTFDRTHAARDLSPALRKPALHLKPFVETRLRAELAREAERQAARTDKAIAPAAA